MTSPDQQKREREKIIERIHSLRAMTVERGCTEAEAEAAAQAAQRLIEKHGLTDADLDNPVDDDDVLLMPAPYPSPLDGRHLHPTIAIAGSTVADFFECRCFSAGSVLWVIGDEPNARRTHDLLKRVYARVEALFIEFKLILSEDPSLGDGLHGRTIATEFRKGFGLEVLDRFVKERERREQSTSAGSASNIGHQATQDGTAIVLSNTAALDDALVDDIMALVGVKASKIKFRSEVSSPFAAGTIAGRLIKLFDHEPEPTKTFREALDEPSEALADGGEAPESALHEAASAWTASGADYDFEEEWRPSTIIGKIARFISELLADLAHSTAWAIYRIGVNMVVLGLGVMAFLDVIQVPLIVQGVERDQAVLAVIVPGMFLWFIGEALGGDMPRRRRHRQRPACRRPGVSSVAA